MKMELVALEAQERLIPPQQVVCDTSVSVVADRALFYHGLVLENEGPLLGRVAFETEIIQSLLGLQIAHL